MTGEEGKAKRLGQWRYNRRLEVEGWPSRVLLFPEATGRVEAPEPKVRTVGDGTEERKVHKG